MTLIKANLADLSYDKMDFLIEWGCKPFRKDQLFDAVMQFKSYDEISNLPKEVINKLKENFFDHALKVEKTIDGKDGVQKFLFRLNDSNIIEGVFMPHNYGNTLCVSTQIGCRMGCSFCASGLNGLVRNLTAGEILSQVLSINRIKGGDKNKRAITNVVLMGSGEPLDNFDNTIDFLKMISHPKGINISLRNISLSTCGIPPKIIELADLSLPVTLSISLHAATDKKRNKIMEINKAYNLFSVIEAAKYYFEKTKRRIIFEYALIDNENSDEQSAEELARLIRGLNCHVNLINLNPVREKGHRGVSNQKIKDFMAALDRNNISNTLRRSMGNDIDGACGQLRNSYIKEGNAH
ncbi:MAG: 23S rRNA (adenine(2503)-C(2))-methyltransferase RlmN [Bacillota bacterium]